MSLNHLRNAPIREAILNVSFEGTVEMALLDKFTSHKFIKRHYPTRRKLLALQLTGKFEADSKNLKHDPITASHTDDGFILRSKNGGNRAIQIKVGQLSFHNVNDYGKWDEFRDEFKKVWDVFCEVVGRKDLTQMGLRYINNIDLELPLENGFAEYLNLLPSLPDGLNNSIDSFFIQINSPNEEQTLNSTITETFNKVNDKLNVILDINVSKGSGFKCNSPEMWEGLEEMRSYKNHLFEHCLTKKTLKLYE